MATPQYINLPWGCWLYPPYLHGPLKSIPTSYQNHHLGEKSQDATKLIPGCSTFPTCRGSSIQLPKKPRRQNLSCCWDFATSVEIPRKGWECFSKAMFVWYDIYNMVTKSRLVITCNYIVFSDRIIQFKGWVVHSYIPWYLTTHWILRL